MVRLFRAMLNPKAAKDPVAREDLLRHAEAKLRESLVDSEQGATVLPPAIVPPKADADGSKPTTSAATVQLAPAVRFSASGEVVSDAHIEMRARGLDVGSKVVPGPKCRVPAG
eukprot:2257327-Alexandrium_andersonii.AAC.1